MTKELTEDEVMFLRHGISVDDAEMREDLSFMFSDMRRQAEILRHLQVKNTDESSLIFVREHQAP